MSGHRVAVEAQTWRNVPPYPPVTLYRSRCTCGATSVWCAYKGNVPKRCSA